MCGSAEAVRSRHDPLHRGGGASSRGAANAPAVTHTPPTRMPASRVVFLTSQGAASCALPRMPHAACRRFQAAHDLACSRLLAPCLHASRRVSVTPPTAGALTRPHSCMQPARPHSYFYAVRAVPVRVGLRRRLPPCPSLTMQRMLRGRPETIRMLTSYRYTFGPRLRSVASVCAQ